MAGAANPRPVVMFVDRSGPGLARKALEAGVAAYVVDGLAPGRVQSIVETAIDRFQMTQAMRQDLEKARTDLANRKVIERAKGVLMKIRGARGGGGSGDAVRTDAAGRRRGLH